MKTITDAYRTAAKATVRYPNLTANINGTILSGRKEIVSAQITLGETSKPSYFETALASGAVGSITVDRRTIDISSVLVSGNPIVITAEFYSAADVLLGSNVLGTFFITSYDIQDKTYGIINFADALIYTGVEFNPENLPYPCACSTMISAAFTQAGISGVSMSLPVDPTFVNKPYKAEEPVAEGMYGYPYTCRDIIAGIAGTNLGCLFIAYDGTPKLYAYGNANATAVSESILLALDVSTETYGIDNVVCYTSAEKMAKTTANYRKLPYSPYFNGMESIAPGSSWYSAAMQQATVITHWDWATATATIQGVGEIERGDRITFTADGETVNMFITGIVYHFDNAHFTETLYSFAFTEEEYQMSPQKSVDAGAKSEGTHVPQWFSSPSDPAATASNSVKASDMWLEIDSIANHNAVSLRQRKTKTENNVPVQVWELLGYISSGGGGSGVGEWLDADHTIERFNLYEDIDQWDTANSSTMLYDHIEGYSNHMTGSGEGYNHLEGKSNTGANCHGCSLGGTYNQAYNCYASDIEGSSNTVYGAQYSHISGDNNTIGDANTSAGAELDISGGYHTVKNSSRITMNGQRNSAINCQDVAAFGQNNSATKLSYGFIAGQNNSAQNSFGAQFDIDYAFIFGSGCSAGHSNSFVCGENGTDANSAIFAVGGGSSGNNFEVKSGASGHVYARGYDTYSSDYAEYFEWSDGNPNDDDRMGLLVDQIGDRIAPAQGCDFFGAISARASVIGNAYENYWHGKYQTDIFGRPVFDEDGAPAISPEFDSGREYVPRSQRPEWAVVGMVGRVIIIDDGSCLPGSYVLARKGVGSITLKETRARCLRRLDGTHIEILIR